MKEKNATGIVDAMFEGDAFSQWLGIERLEIQAGSCVLRMKVREEMVNGFGIAHGGISYSFADSAFAFASNSRGKKAVSIETSISHLKAIQVDDELTARANEESRSNKLAVYRVTVHNQQDELVALFKGMVYRTSEDWKLV